MILNKTFSFMAASMFAASFLTPPAAAQNNPASPNAANSAYTKLYETSASTTQGRNFYFDNATKLLTYDTDISYSNPSALKDNGEKADYPYNTRLKAAEVVDCQALRLGRVVYSTALPGKAPFVLGDEEKTTQMKTLLAQLREKPADAGTIFNTPEGVYIAKVCTQYQRTTYNTIEESKPLILANGTVVSCPAGGLTATKTPNSAPELVARKSTLSAKDDAPIPRNDFKHLKSNNFAHIFAGNFNYTPQYQVLQFDTLAYAINDISVPKDTQILSHLVLSCSESRGTSFRTQVKIPGQKLQVIVKPEDVNAKTYAAAERLGLYPADMKPTFDALCAQYMNGAKPI